MAKTSGLGQYLLVDGSNVSGDIGALSRIGGGNAPLDVTDITQSANSRIGGRRDGAIEFSSYFDPAAAASHAVFKALPYTDAQIAFLHGQAIGNDGASMVAKQVNYDGTRGTDGSFTFAISAQSNGYGLEWGYQATPGLRTDTTATNGASLDGAASSSFGWQAYAHVTAFTGTNITLTLQDSADNATFAGFTGSAFTAFTATGAQRLAGLNTSTVRRYVRVASTGTFTSCTFYVMFVRNESAGVVF